MTPCIWSSPAAVHLAHMTHWTNLAAAGCRDPGRSQSLFQASPNCIHHNLLTNHVALYITRLSAVLAGSHNSHNTSSYTQYSLVITVKRPQLVNQSVQSESRSKTTLLHCLQFKSDNHVSTTSALYRM